MAKVFFAFASCILLIQTDLFCQEYQPYELPTTWVTPDEQWDVKSLSKRIDENNQDARNYSEGFSKEFSTSQAEYTERLIRSGKIYQGVPGLNRFLDSIINALVAESVLEKYQFEARLYHGSQLNAFTLSSGRIMIYPLLLAECRNEDELAMILGHEIGHNVHCDVYESALKHYRSERLSAFSFWRFVTLARALKFDREQESQADAYANQLLENSDYSSHAGMQIFELFQNWEKVAEWYDHIALKEESTIFSTHPTSDERLQTLRALNDDTTGGKSSLSFLRIKKYCRKEALNTMLREHKYQEALMNGWRYSAQEEDIDLKNMALDATRRYLAFHPADSNERVIKTLFNLPIPSTDKDVPLYLADQVFLGSDVTLFRPPFNEPNLTFKELFEAQLNEVKGAENCTECLLTRALVTKNEAQKTALLKQYCSSSNSNKRMAVCSSSENSASIPEEGNILLIPEKLEVMVARSPVPMVVRPKIHYVSRDSAISALGFENPDSPLHHHSAGEVKLLEATLSDMNPRSLDKTQNMINLMRIIFVEICPEQTAFIVDPTLSSYMHEINVKGFDFIDVEALMKVKPLIAMHAGLGLLEFRRFRVERRRIEGQPNGTFVESFKVYDRNQTLHSKSLDKMYRFLYNESEPPKKNVLQKIYSFLYEDGM